MPLPVHQTNNKSIKSTSQGKHRGKAKGKENFPFISLEITMKMKRGHTPSSIYN